MRIHACAGKEKTGRFAVGRLNEWGGHYTGSGREGELICYRVFGLPSDTSNPIRVPRVGGL